MTPRYRCCFCGSFRGNAKDTRNHIVIKHRKALLGFLNIIESYGIKEDPLTPSTPLRRSREPNTGVSGEGDSS